MKAAGKPSVVFVTLRWLGRWWQMHCGKTPRDVVSPWRLLHHFILHKTSVHSLPAAGTCSGGRDNNLMVVCWCFSLCCCSLGFSSLPSDNFILSWVLERWTLWGVWWGLGWGVGARVVTCWSLFHYLALALRRDSFLNKPLHITVVGGKSPQWPEQRGEWWWWWWLVVQPLLPLTSPGVVVCVQPCMLINGLHN